MPCPTTPEPKRPILILFMGWMDERVEDSVQLFVLDQKPVAVSYTHLDVYKRQGFHGALRYFDHVLETDGLIRAIYFFRGGVVLSENS